jgi:hypothetical protein
MEKQSGGEFASTDAAAGAQDAALQELWLSAEIPVEPCSRLQHLQRPTPSHLGSDTPDATRRGDENMARGRRSDVRIPVANGSTTLASPQRDNTTATDLVTICDGLPTVRTPVQIVLNAVTRKTVRMRFGIRGASTRAVPIFNLSRADMGAPDFTNARRQAFAQACLLVR